MKKTFITLLLFSSLAFLNACTAPGNNNNVTPSVQPTVEVLPTDTPTPTFTPTPSPIPEIVTDEKLNTTVFLSEYKGIKLNPVSDADIDSQIDNILSNYATNVSVDRAAELGDTLLIYFVGKIDGVPFENGSYEEAPGYELILGSGSFIDGFEEQLVGSKAGDKVSVNVTFPENYSEGLSGKAAVFDVTVNSVMEYKMPELTDEFVKTNFDFETAVDFIASIKKQMTDDSYNEQIINYLVDNIKIENLSDDELKAYSDNMYNFYYDKANSYATFLQTDISNVLLYYYGLPSVEALREVSDLTASTSVRFKHIVKAISSHEGMFISDEEFSGWVDANHENYGFASSDEMLQQYDKNSVLDFILADKVYDFLLDNSVK